MFDIGDLVWAGYGRFAYLVIDQWAVPNASGQNVWYYKLLNVKEDRNIKRDEPYLQRCHWVRYEHG